jgi:hypothetical protein
VTVRVDRQPSGDRHESRQQAAAGLAVSDEQARRSSCRGTLVNANLVLLADACETAGVTLGWLGAPILAWLAYWESATCATVSGPVPGPDTAVDRLSRGLEYLRERRRYT